MSKIWDFIEAYDWVRSILARKCNDRFGPLYKLAVTLYECKMQTHLFLFKSHKITFPEVVSEIAIYALNGTFVPMAKRLHWTISLLIL